MSKQPHRQQGAPSMGGGNSGRRSGAQPQNQTGAGAGKKTQVGRKKSGSKPQQKAA
jgi:hypothetical protein